MKTYLKFSITLLLYLFTNQIVAQKLPSDSTILKTIFGKVDKSKKSYTRPFTEEEKGTKPRFKKVKFSISIKKIVVIDSISYLIVVADAPITMQYYHELGYRNIYKLKKTKGKWQVISKLINPILEVQLIRIDSFYIENIGKSNKSLVLVNQSDGNSHLESNYIFYDINNKNIEQLLYFEKYYSNEAWSFADSSGKCKASIRECKYELIKNESKWYDIKIVNTEYQGSCMVGDFEGNIEILNKDTNKILDTKIEFYEYKDGNYVLKK